MAEFGRKRSCLEIIKAMAQGRKEEEIGTLLLGNDENNVFVNYLLSYFFVLKLLGLNGYLKGYLKSRINKLPKKNKY